MSRENRKKVIKAGFLLLFLNLCFFILAGYGKIPLLFQEWKKGPLINKSSAYFSIHAFRLFWISSSAFLNLYFLISFLLHRLIRKINFLMTKWYFIIFTFIALGISFMFTEYFLGSYIRHSRWGTQFRPHPHLFWWNRPNLKNAKYYSDRSATSTNSMGFRYQEDIPFYKPEFEYRIFVLGNSSTFGVGVSDTETFAAQLESLLKKGTKKYIRVINAACPGHSTYQNLIEFKTMILPFHPDMVIIANNNDACLEYIEDKKRVCRNVFIRNFKIVFYKSDFFLLCQRVILDLVIYFKAEFKKFSMPPLVPRVSLSDYKEIIEEMIEIAERNNIRLSFINMPVNYATLEKFPFLRELFYREEYPAALIQLCQQYNQILINIDADWNTNKENGLFELVCFNGVQTDAHFHPSQKGHLKIAEQIYKIIVTQKLISSNVK